MAIKAINIDNKEYLRGTNERYTLIMADPPYGINGNSHRKNKSRGRLAKSNDYHMALWDQPVPDDEYFDLIFSKSDHQVIFGGNYFNQLGTPFATPRRNQIKEFLESHPFGWIAWDKCNGNTGFNDYELIWTSFKYQKSFVYKYMWNGFMQGASIQNGSLMNPIKSLNEKRIHPTQKPVRLYKFLFREFNQWTGKVLDTHLGSGSSAIAADEMGIDFTGLEIERKYYEDYIQRHSIKKIQLKIFQ